MITRIQALLLAGILGLTAFVFASSGSSAVSNRAQAAAVETADPLAWAAHVDVSELKLPQAAASSDGSATVIESQAAANCAAGGWKFIVSGYPQGRCCASTRRWVKYVGATAYYKCCGACPQ